MIFLRKLMEGGVAHSFGLHVARMAGMPKQVLESAEKTLAALEHGSPSCGSQGRNIGEMPCSSAGRDAATAQASFTGISGGEPSVTRKRNIVKPYNVKEGRVESDGSLQLSFFQLEDPLLASLKEELDKADLNNMTPLQAFDLLRNMKEQLGI